MTSRKSYTNGYPCGYREEARSSKSLEVTETYTSTIIPVPMELTQEQFTRYSRHIMLPEVGLEGQKKLLKAKVLLIGAGGLGSPLGLYLAAAGIGTIGIVDFDTVDLSNLQRQILHTNDSVGTSKLDSAETRIKAMNPDVQVVKYKVRLTSDNVLDIIKDYDIIIDGTDNFPTRYLTNDACVLLGKTNIYGSIFRFEGQATVFKPKNGPCYRCLFPEPPPPGAVPSCAEGGVLGILPGIIGVIQATEAIKSILGKGDLLVGRLVLYDSLKMKFRELKIQRDPECPLCGDHPTITKLIDYEEFCGLRRGGNDPTSIPAISVKDLKVKMDKKGDFLLLDVREPEEYAIAKMNGAKLIPLAKVSERAKEIAAYKDKDIYVCCHHGARSLQACMTLKAMGFSKVANVTGGIEAWSVQVDPSIPRY